MGEQKALYTKWGKKASKGDTKFIKLKSMSLFHTTCAQIYLATLAYHYYKKNFWSM